MLTTVCLDDEAPLQTDEINDVMVDRDLALELELSEPLGAENLPKSMLSGRGH